jgi:Flp pilus assembly pilin Flp
MKPGACGAEFLGLPWPVDSSPHGTPLAPPHAGVSLPTRFPHAPDALPKDTAVGGNTLIDAGICTQLEDPMKAFKNLLRKEDGQDMVEYALLAAFISIIAIVTIRNIGPLVDAIYQNVQSALS